ncbi:MAG: hypothetical protein VKS61_01250 [Candidatus Sericytochromatia bacterium]|nr:hypothetical protein [Candidatus Sericytochromatia bacterium]
MSACTSVARGSSVLQWCWQPSASTRVTVTLRAHRPRRRRLRQLVATTLASRWAQASQGM